MPKLVIIDKRAMEYHLLDSSATSATSTSYTFTSAAFGTADPERFIIVGVGTSVSGGGLPSSMTIGGVAATRIKSSSLGTNPTCDVWYALVPTGATGNIVVIYSSNAARAVSIIVYSILPVVDASYSSNKGGVSNSASDLLDIPATGVAFGFACGNGNGTVTWSGLTEDVDFVNGSLHTMTSASLQSPSGQNGLNSQVIFAVATVNSTVFVVFQP